MYLGVQVQCHMFSSCFNKIWILSSFHKGCQYQISRKSVEWEASNCARTDGHEGNRRFRYCEKAPYSEYYIYRNSYVIEVCICIKWWFICLRWPRTFLNPGNKQLHLLDTSNVTADTNILYIPRSRHVGRDSSVGIATRCGLDGTGIESRWGWGFPASVQTGLGAHPASYKMGTGFLSRG